MRPRGRALTEEQFVIASLCAGISSGRIVAFLHHLVLRVPDSAIRDHVLVRTRGRPICSTRRNLSHFEHVEDEFNPT